MVYSRHSHTEDPLYYPVVIKDEQRFWKRILIVDADVGTTLAFKLGIKDSNIYTNALSYPRLAIISMSWLFNNMKRKVENGHCNNTKHDHGDRNPRLCVKGSELHKKLYDESLKSFEGVLELAREHAPKTITSPQK